MNRKKSTFGTVSPVNRAQTVCLSDGQGAQSVVRITSVAPESICETVPTESPSFQTAPANNAGKQLFFVKEREGGWNLLGEKTFLDNLNRYLKFR